MAFTDARLLYSDNQAITATTNATNAYDSSPLFAGNSGVDFGSGRSLVGVVNITETFDSAGGTARLFVRFRSKAADTNVGSMPFVTHFDSGPIDEVLLLRGYRIVFRLDTPGGADQDFLRFTGFRYVANTENFTAGKLTAFVIPEASVLRQYGSGLSFA